MSLSSLTLGIYVATVLVPLALSVLVYYLLFDPLRHFKGPFIARFTNAYAVYHAVRRRLHLQTFSDLQQYGSVYRQGPDRLVFNTVTALHDIYLDPRATKGRAYRYSSLEGQENMLNTIDRQRRRQKLAWPTLSSIGMNKFIIWWNKAKFNAFRTLLTRIINTRVALPRDAKNDLYSIAATEAGKNSENLSRAEMSEHWGEATFLTTIPGGMTTSSTLTAVFFYLSRHPAAHRRLVSEIRTTFPDAQDIRSGPLLAGCTSLRAIIDECLRISVPTTSMPWREEETVLNRHSSTKPFIVGGHVIPPGTMVVVNTYCIKHNEAYFSDRFAFQPERWLDEGNSKTLRRAFVPFGIGEATDESCVAKTLWHFDLEQAPGEAGRLGGGSPEAKDKARARADEFQLYDGIVSDHDGPNLVVTKRKC
ncbi:cytochrome P450 [Aaosphaeria arxii CBS 175.79]|uniref:Cytochrome P450 n=1 Tax=Aaosphaeria arxii CBS 175.79 TaxID=1450172 RepID=A0A6A5XQF2_9PLEO|nr:cytochrome P450 [Aaosphaeria arxii CBS 175.79]KAF2015119.1 cytochrome P450 [Aaosphaeria arxii CBS 175.79]